MDRINPDLREALRPIERFHLPFPNAEQMEYSHQLQISHASGEPDKETPIMELPFELSALVFSFLTPAALDAARCTSREWRARILIDNWTLSAVLEPNSVVPRRSSVAEDHWKRSERLQRALDGVTALPMRFTAVTRTNRPRPSFLTTISGQSEGTWHIPSRMDSSDTWRTRFRERKFEFFIPPRCGHQHPGSQMYSSVVSSVGLSETAEFAAFVVTDTTDTDPLSYRASTLVVYRLGLLPLFIGATQYSRLKCPLELLKIQCKATEYQLPQSWVLKIDIAGEVASYQVKSFESFGNGDDHYEFISLGSEKTNDQSLWGTRPLTLKNALKNETARHRPNLVSGNWEFLAYLPTDLSPHAEICWEFSRHSVRYAAAKCTDTGDVFVLRLAYREDRYWYPTGRPQKPVAFLAPPKQGLVFKNLSVASSWIYDHRTVIAIIWQETKSDYSRPELYTYSFRSRQLATEGEIYSDVTEPPPESCVEIQGKRIISLDRRMGGVHRLSPLREFFQNNPSSRPDDEDALGGLQVTCRRFTNEERQFEGSGVQKVTVFGPNDENSRITFRTFDLSFGDLGRLRQIRIMTTEGGYGELKHLNCACHLHDEGFRITLPDTWCKVAYTNDPIPPPFEPNTMLSSWLRPWLAWITKSAPTTTTKSTGWIEESDLPARGRIEQSDSPARQAALEREQEYLKDMIRWMKETGLSEESIETEWSGAPWTGRGQLKKPDGWREL